MGQLYNFRLGRDYGFGSGPDDYSTYANFTTILPFQAIGKHEIDCYGRADSDGFDGEIETDTVSAPFRGNAPIEAPIEDQSAFTVRM